MDTMRAINTDIAKLAISSIASSRAIARSPRPKIGEEVEKGRGIK